MSEEEKIEQPTDDSQPSTENTSDENIHPTLNTQHNKENMEVHKHPHHVTHIKKWGEYLLEFFMLFLAVFLGFVAENIRESSAERGREKEYMISLLSDLKQDTISANKTINKNRLLIAGEDSTLNFLAGNLHNGDTAEMALLYFYKYGIYLNTIRKNDGTISQLKNNGGLRLLRNKEVIDKINEYYNEIANVMGQERTINEFLNLIDKQAGEIFNYSANKNFIDSANLTETYLPEIPLTKLSQWLAHGSPTMVTTDLKALSPFMSNISYHMGLMQTYILLLKRQKTKAIELMQAIKNGYHLENE